MDLFRQLTILLLVPGEFAESRFQGRFISIVIPA